ARMSSCDVSKPYPAVYFLGPQLPATIYIAGSPTVELYAGATTPDTDLFVTLYEQNALLPGTVKRIAYGAIRARWREGFDQPRPLPPEGAVKLPIEMFPVMYKVSPGSSLLLEISGARCGFAENPNTGEPDGAQTRRLATTQSIFHDSLRPSKISLP